MRAGLALTRLLVPVQSRTDDRSPPPPPQPEEPSAGARWGKASRFGFDDERPASLRATYGWLHEDRVFRGVESHREYAGVAARSDGSVTAEAIRSVTFLLGQRVEYSEEWEHGIFPRLIETTVRSYVQLSFPFALEGTRGEPPPPETPPPPEERSYG